MIDRRAFISGLAGLSFSAAPLAAGAQTKARKLAMPPLVDATGDRRFSLTAQKGMRDFTGLGAGETWGFNQSYLGPTLRLSSRASTQARIENTLPEEISVHWHGMLIPGHADGGPHQTIASGATWAPELNVMQPPATLWYHSHVHRETGKQVQKGLAGVLHVTDGQDDAKGLPSEYGIDDLTLVLQDRRFDRRGRIDYGLSMPDQMMGFMGNVMLVNGQMGTHAVVPRGIVRLRLLNGSNARIYPLTFADRREMHLIATDSGYLDRPVAIESLVIAPGERYEVLVDFSRGEGGTLMSAASPNQMMGGAGADFEVLPFSVDGTLPARIAKIPTDLGGDLPAGKSSSGGRRKITLDMPMGMGMMMRGLNDRFGINGRAFDMRRIDLSIAKGSTEIWEVSSSMMMHPFHVHGVRFQVLTENGRNPSIQNTGWKDTVLVNGRAEILIDFDQAADRGTPFMYHCHILEHEDGGMMGQFTVT
ncbi:MULTISPECIES: multicopper oxidase family protein [unclassified Thioclava]|uniref:multicopper oxidase family protein n=1 Tax=unclassified Thioclava TaxID=2621713 RepID=UPI00099742D2|nr:MULTISPECIES: multicopper oxidase domain-containing protein [unclassified Thioclava]OOY05389.1 biphenyl 2,3-dioxygenase [Thioclava sp. F28-4]OOY06913.1 biphenyl 2,3-dioxygenase [Thioclava sp. F36-7]